MDKIKIIKIISGKHKNKTGSLIKISYNNKKKAYMVFVKNINVVKKHTKPDIQKKKPGGIISKENGIHCSNIVFLN